MASNVSSLVLLAADNQERFSVLDGGVLGSGESKLATEVAGKSSGTSSVLGIWWKGVDRGGIHITNAWISLFNGSGNAVGDVVENVGRTENLLVGLLLWDESDTLGVDREETKTVSGGVSVGQWRNVLGAIEIGKEGVEGGFEVTDKETGVALSQIKME